MNRDADKLLLILVENNRHRVAPANVIVDQEFDSSRSSGARRNRQIALRIRVLDQIFFWRDVLLRQIFHLLRIVLEFFLLLLDDALPQPSATSALVLLRRIDRRLDRLSVGAHAYLKSLLFAFFAAE